MFNNMQTDFLSIPNHTESHPTYTICDRLLKFVTEMVLINNDIYHIFRDTIFGIQSPKATSSIDT